MPRLPSGRHLALGRSPLKELIDQAYEGKFVHVLMAIEEVAHVFPFVEVLYFRPKSAAGEELPLSQYSTLPPDDLEAYPSGFNLVSIHVEAEKWSGEDQKAFVEFLNDPVRQGYFVEALQIVRGHQQRLLANPSTVPGMMATWWKHGCHPLQEDVKQEYPN